jgi:hypothetical protein
MEAGGIEDVLLDEELLPPLLSNLWAEPGLLPTLLRRLEGESDRLRLNNFMK